MVGNKLLLAIIKQDDFPDRVTDGRQQPLTELEHKIRTHHMLGVFDWRKEADTSKIEGVLGSPERYVLKQYHSYGSRDVLDGRDLGREAGDRFADLLRDGGYIAQEVCEHGTQAMAVVNDDGSPSSWDYLYFILGAYVISGKCVAIEAKLSADIPITMNFGHTKSGAYRTAVFPTVS